MSNDFDLKCQKLEFFQSDQNILIFWNQCMLLVWKLTKYIKSKNFHSIFLEDIETIIDQRMYLVDVQTINIYILLYLKSETYSKIDVSECDLIIVMNIRKNRWNFSSKKTPKIFLIACSNEQKRFWSDSVQWILITKLIS